MADSKHKTPGLVVVISDSLGDTACDVVLAAAGQFSEGAIEIKRIPHVESVDQVAHFIEPIVAEQRDLAVFHTIVDVRLRAQLLDYLSRYHISAMDLIGPTIAVLRRLTHEEPRGIAGVIHKTDERYFKRIEAMEYFVQHDDGAGTEELEAADIVLVGVSRTSKTPLSMYLAYLGYKVANVPLAHGLEPPKELETIDPAKIFGLISSADTLVKIRDTRLGSDYARAVAGSYADKGAVEDELLEARQLMKRLGCFVIYTDGKSIEESAREIVTRMEKVAEARARRNRS